MGFEGYHKPGTWGEENIKLVNCAACGVELLGQRLRHIHLPQWASEHWERLFIRLPDEERPLANHTRPFCYACAQIVMARAG
jgi:hypothetical protein